jgi:excisionase family DNA binding protein
MSFDPEIWSRGLTYKDLARRWSVSVRHARRIVARLRIPTVRLGHRTVRFRPADVDRAEVNLSGRGEGSMR